MLGGGGSIITQAPARLYTSTLGPFRVRPGPPWNFQALGCDEFAHVLPSTLDEGEVGPDERAK